MGKLPNDAQETDPPEPTDRELTIVRFEELEAEVDGLRVCIDELTAEVARLHQVEVAGSGHPPCVWCVK